MTLDEIEQKVKHSLEEINRDGAYDWRLTFYNTEAKKELEELCYKFSTGTATEEQLKQGIKEFRDRSETSYIDFCIKTPEPSLKQFERMNRLFGPLDKNVRLVPPRANRKQYNQTKILETMRLTMETKQAVSEKLRQQFNWMMVREKQKTPEMLAVSLNFETYNAYQRKFDPPGAVAITTHGAVEKKDEAPMFAPTEVDNSSFEARLAQDPVKAVRSLKASYNPRPEQIVVAIMEAPHELPTEIHEEFAAYCLNLYEKL